MEIKLKNHELIDYPNPEELHKLTLLTHDSFLDIQNPKKENIPEHLREYYLRENATVTIYVSCGAGWQSSYIPYQMFTDPTAWNHAVERTIYKAKERKGYDIDREDIRFLIIFADTGEEVHGTYEFIQHQYLEFLNEMGFVLRKITRAELYETELTLLQEYTEKKGIPTRKFRSCTDKWKIRSMRKYLRNQDLRFSTALIGITGDEAHRMSTADVKWQYNHYPLSSFDRKEIVNKMLDLGLDKVEKSGCYFCPFIEPSRVLEYVEEHPEMLDRVINMEERALEENPELMIYHKPIKRMIEIKESQTSLSSFFENMDMDEINEKFDEEAKHKGMCFSGHCGV